MKLPRWARSLGMVLVPLSLAVTLLAWGVSSPPGSSPDDDYHLASIWCAQGIEPGQCEEAGAEVSRRVPAELVDWVGCFKFRPDVSAACPVDVGELSSTKRGNWYVSAYPPVFYGTMSLFVTDDVSTSVILMRSANALLYVAVLAGLFFLLPRGLRPVLVWGAAVTAVPLGLFLIPSVNPSSWAVLSATGLWVAAWGFFRAEGWRKWALAGMTSLLLVVGAGARSDAAVYGVLALAVACVLSASRTRAFARDLLLPFGLVVIAVLFFFSGRQSAVVTSDTAASDGDIPLSLLAFINIKQLPELWAGVFGIWQVGGLGWLDTTMPGVVWVFALVVFGGVSFWGMRTGDVRKWIVVAGVSLSLVAVPMYILLNDGVVVGQFVQPRYIYPLIIVLAGVVLIGLSGAALGLGRLQLVLVAVALAIAAGVALHVNLRRYITGLDNETFNLNDPIEWWWNAPVSPMLVWFAGSAAAALTAGLLVAFAWSSATAASARLAQMAGSEPSSASES
ncbi:DUF2142 domain-containing protein [Microbacterium atlanticum]|uniref:DUF2142 domain-containing protein n=1 Tax=Microbacterium atlanticum TaxID=2782168 RepID=UPI001887B00F|nr:DUF2142 domain-containing protein [Microbacterium atlanticum]